MDGSTARPWLHGYVRPVISKTLHRRASRSRSVWSSFSSHWSASPSARRWSLRSPLRSLLLPHSSTLSSTSASAARCTCCSTASVPGGQRAGDPLCLGPRSPGRRSPGRRSPGRNHSQITQRVRRETPLTGRKKEPPSRRKEVTRRHKKPTMPLPRGTQKPKGTQKPQGTQRTNRSSPMAPMAPMREVSMSRRTTLPKPLSKPLPKPPGKTPQKMPKGP